MIVILVVLSEETGLEELIPLNINIGEEGESNGRICMTTVAPKQLGKNYNWFLLTQIR